MSSRPHEIARTSGASEHRRIALRSVITVLITVILCHDQRSECSAKRHRDAPSRDRRDPVAPWTQGNRTPDGRTVSFFFPACVRVSALSAQMTLLNHRFATPWTAGIGLPLVSSVPGRGKGTKETSLPTNEAAINFPSTIASFARAFHAGGALRARRRKTFRQLSAVRFPINDLLGRSSYTARS